VREPESIADHSHGTCLVALALGPRVEPPLDVDRAVALAAVHDVPEALLTDLPRSCTERLPEGAKAAAEARAAADLLGPLSALAHERFAEYAAAETREARFARLCDRLHMGVEMVALRRAGHAGLEDFAASVAGTDCSEFPPCAELQEEILAAFEASGGR
jgi:putative hydrolase of HD superfamily